jgi:hypothetical protein
MILKYREGNLGKLVISPFPRSRDVLIPFARL